jgi:hypothetical protein
MAICNVRTGVQVGQILRLRVLFSDGAGCAIAPDALPDLYLYSPDVTDADREADIAAVTFTNATSGPLVPALLSTGYYEYLYTVPGVGPAGSWHDVWHAQQSGVDVVGDQSFTVTDTLRVQDQSVGYNTMLLVELSPNIEDSTNTLTLSGETQFFYLTRFQPFYASADMIRMRVGPWISYLPDDTLALIIHWSSLEADNLQGAVACSSTDLAYAKTQFVLCDASLRALSYQGHGQTPASAASSSSGSKKQLGDLAITAASSSASDSIVTVDAQIIESLEECRDEWARVVNAGGNIVPGGGFGIEGAVRGKYDPMRKASGRVWEDPRSFRYPAPAVNARGNSGRPAFFTAGAYRRRTGWSYVPGRDD